MSATADTADEVSMTKIMLGPDQAAVAAQVLDLDRRSVLDFEAISPLDHDGALLGQLVQSQVGQLFWIFNSVEVDVSHLHATRIDAHQLKRRAGHPGRRPCALRHAAHERGLAGSELAAQQHDVAGPETFAETPAGELGLGR